MQTLGRVRVLREAHSDDASFSRLPPRRSSAPAYLFSACCLPQWPEVLRQVGVALTLVPEKKISRRNPRPGVPAHRVKVGELGENICEWRRGQAGGGGGQA